MDEIKNNRVVAHGWNTFAIDNMDESDPSQ
jgi:hypothetical protein